MLSAVLGARDPMTNKTDTALMARAWSPANDTDRESGAVRGKPMVCESR